MRSATREAREVCGRRPTRRPGLAMVGPRLRRRNRHHPCGTTRSSSCPHRRRRRRAVKRSPMTTASSCRRIASRRRSSRSSVRRVGSGRRGCVCGGRMWSLWLGTSTRGTLHELRGALRGSAFHRRSSHSPSRRWSPSATRDENNSKQIARPGRKAWGVVPGTGRRSGAGGPALPMQAKINLKYNLPIFTIVLVFLTV